MSNRLGTTRHESVEISANMIMHRARDIGRNRDVITTLTFEPPSETSARRLKKVEAVIKGDRK